MKKLLLLMILPSLAFASIMASTVAPTGYVKAGVPVLGKAYYEYEIRNDTGSQIQCRIVRRACMNNVNDCIDDEKTYTINRKGHIRDNGSYLYIPVTYNYAGNHTTSSYIKFYGCGDTGSNKADWSHYHVSN